MTSRTRIDVDEQQHIRVVSEDLLKYLTNGAPDGKLVLHEAGQEITEIEKINNALQAALQESLVFVSSECSP